MTKYYWNGKDWVGEYRENESRQRRQIRRVAEEVLAELRFPLSEQECLAAVMHCLEECFEVV